MSIGTGLMPTGTMPGPLGGPTGGGMAFAPAKVLKVVKAAAGSASRFKALYLWKTATTTWAWKQRLVYSKAYNDLRGKYSRDTGKSPGPWPVVASKKPPKRGEFGA